MMGMREPAGQGRLWAINGKVPADVYQVPPLIEAKRGSTQLLVLINRTAFEHPIHLHGHAFRVLTRNCREEPR